MMSQRQEVAEIDKPVPLVPLGFRLLPEIKKIYICNSGGTDQMVADLLQAGSGNLTCWASQTY